MEGMPIQKSREEKDAGYRKIIEDYKEKGAAATPKDLAAARGAALGLHNTAPFDGTTVGGVVMENTTDRDEIEARTEDYNRIT